MRLIGIPLAVALVLSAGAAGAQDYDTRYGPAPYGDYSHRSGVDRGPLAPLREGDGQYDWARVLRVDPVFDGRGQVAYDPRRCETRRDGYASGDGYRDGYGTRDVYRDVYRDEGDGGAYRRDDRYADPYRQSRREENGRMVATVLGGIAGAVLGSKVGDGSGRYIGTAVGSMVGGMAGRGIYEANQRRERDAYVTVCEPDPYRDQGYRGDDGYGYGDAGYGDARAVEQYDVTYEYAGRQYTTRTRHHPGDRIRVRVDVRAE